MLRTSKFGCKVAHALLIGLEIVERCPECGDSRAQMLGERRLLPGLVVSIFQLLVFVDAGGGERRVAVAVDERLQAARILYEIHKAAMLTLVSSAFSPSSSSANIFEYWRELRRTILRRNRRNAVFSSPTPLLMLLLDPQTATLGVNGDQRL